MARATVDLTTDLVGRRRRLCERQRVTKLRSVLASVIILTMGLTGCSGQGGDETGRQDAGPPRAKPGYAKVLSNPVDFQPKKDLASNGTYAPFVHFSVDALGTIETIQKNGKKLRPAEGERFYVVQFAIEPQMSEVRLARRLEPETRLALFPRGVGVRTSSSFAGPDLTQLYEEVLDDKKSTTEHQKIEHHTIVASGSQRNPPVLQVFEAGVVDNHVELNLVNGKVSGPTPMIDPVPLDLSESYSDKMNTDSPLDGDIQVNHTIDFLSAELASFEPGAYLADDENVVTVRANWVYDQEGTDSPGPVFDPIRTARLVDADGNVYKANHLSHAGEELVDNGEPVGGLNVLDPGETEQVRFSFAVPRELTKFTFVYEPLIGYGDPDIRLREKTIPLNFASEDEGS